MVFGKVISLKELESILQLGQHKPLQAVAESLFKDGEGCLLHQLGKYEAVKGFWDQNQKLPSVFEMGGGGVGAYFHHLFNSHLQEYTLAIFTILI